MGIMHKVPYADQHRQGQHNQSLYTGTVTGWDSKFELLSLYKCGSVQNGLYVPEIHFFC